MAAGNSGNTVIDAVSGTAEEILSLAFGDNDVITAITVTGETTVEQPRQYLPSTLATTLRYYHWGN